MDGEALKEGGRDDEHRHTNQIIIEPTRVENFTDNDPTLHVVRSSQSPLRVPGNDKGGLVTELYVEKPLLGAQNARTPHPDGVWRQFRVHWANVGSVRPSRLSSRMG
jgi:hypothetical protein